MGSGSSGGGEGEVRLSGSLSSGSARVSQHADGASNASRSRCDAVGVAAAGVAHDIKNMILPVRAMLAASSNPEHAAAVNRCSEHVLRAIEGLRLLTLDPEQGDASSTPAELGAWWAEVEPVMCAAAPRGVELFPDFTNGGAGVRMSRHQLTQVVFYLVNEAVEGLRAAGGGKLHVESAQEREQVEIRVWRRKRGAVGGARGQWLKVAQRAAAAAGGSVAASEDEERVVLTLRMPARSTDAMGPKPESACVSLGDARMRSFAAGLLRGVQVVVTPDPATGEMPEADLWITDQGDAARGAARAFVGRSERRTAVVFGVSEASEEERRVIEVRGPATPSAVRAALVRVAGLVG